MFPGSLTWLRGPRLASPTSTTEVETIHPLVEAPPYGDHPILPAVRVDPVPVRWGQEAVAGPETVIPDPFGFSSAASKPFVPSGECCPIHAWNSWL